MPNHNQIEENLEKELAKKEKRKKPKMKVSGKEVIKLKRIIEGKSKKVRK